MSRSEIIFERRGGLVACLLNRPRALNALSFDMCKALASRLSAFEQDDEVQAVLVKGAGERAFCAGGDIRALHDRLLEVGPLEACAFYRVEYPMNLRINRYKKPYIALLDGITMGGGAGISVHGGYRIVTERTRLAMPETGIGLFPDVGATWFLSRLPHKLGLYMALTGAVAGPGDCMCAGLGTHFVPSARLDALEDALAHANWQPSPGACIDRILRSFAVPPPPAAWPKHLDVIAVCFAEPTLKRVIAALADHQNPWAKEQVEILNKRSPTSLAVSFRQLRQGAGLDIEDVMRLEYRLVRRFMEGHDLKEGIRAVIIDKDNRPRWQPERLDDVQAEDIDRFFAPLPEGDLDLAAHHA